MVRDDGMITGNVDIRDLQKVCPVTIKRTVDGVVQRRNSSDVGVLIGGKENDTVPDNEGGTAWTISNRIEINKWAKYKPIKCSGLGRQGYAMRVQTNFGLTYIPVFVGKFLGKVSEYVFDRTEYTSGQNANLPECDNGRTGFREYWVYDKPTGGNASPYRLTDFRSADETTYKINNVTYQIRGGLGDEGLGYFRRAMPPLQQLAADDGSRRSPASYLENSIDGCFVFNFPQNLEGVSAGLTVRYEDLNMGQGLNIGDFYFGVVFRVVGSSTFFAVTQNTKAGDQGGTEAMGNAVQMALRATATFPHQTAAQLLGDDLSAEVDYFPMMSSIPVHGESISGDDHQDPDAGGNATYYYPDDNLNSVSGTFIALDMEVKRTHISIQIVEATILKFRAYKGGSTLQTLMTIESELICNVEDIGITIRATYKAYKTSLRNELLVTKTVVKYITGSESSPGSIPITLSDLGGGSYTVTGNEFFDLEVEVTDNHRFNRKTNAICSIEMNGSSSATPSKPIPSWEQYQVSG